MPVGTVVKVEGGLGGSRLVVKGVDDLELLIPFVTTICPDVDVAAKRIRIEPPDGLLELNLKAAAGSRKRIRRPVDGTQG